MKFAVHDKVRVKPCADFLVGVVGEIAAIDEERRLPYVVAHDVEGSPRSHAFAEDELERAPIETKVVEGEVVYDCDAFATFVGNETVDDIINSAGVGTGDTIRLIVEVLKRGER
jgi:hypothetical protein